MGDSLIVWSARIVVLFYALRLAIDFLAAEPTRRERWARWAWTAGCLVFLAHLFFAFQFFHHWSHASAVAHTAERTNDVVGFRFGVGIYVNYAFTVLWVVDVVWWWVRAARGEPTPAAVYWTVHAIFAFIFFNATVVFGPPFWKWVVLAGACLLLAARLFVPRSREFQTAPETPAGAA